MKKVAIVTLYGNNNYGNKLQNYALQEILKNKNLYVETIINSSIYNNRQINYKRYIRYKFNCIKYFIICGDREKYFFRHKDSKERKKNFLAFDKLINKNNKIFKFKNINNFNNYDIYFAGSDQIWNPNYGGLSDFDLVTFSDAKKISISASFGISVIDKKYNNRIKKYISKFDAVSVREVEGQKIINSILPNKNVKILIDPTLMLSAEQWNIISKKPKKYDGKKYLLCYFLGGISSTLYNEICEFANKENLKIINLLDKDDDFYSSGPSEFIFLEKNAEIILTDSFHASVFSFIFNVPFVVFNRNEENNQMGSRINTLLNTFLLSDRKYDKDKKIEEYLSYDYEKSMQILKKKQEEFQSFVDKNI